MNQFSKALTNLERIDRAAKKATKERLDQIVAANKKPVGRPKGSVTSGVAGVKKRKSALDVVFKESEIIKEFKSEEIMGKLLFPFISSTMGGAKQMEVFDSWEKHFRGETFPGYKLKLNTPHIITRAEGSNVLTLWKVKEW